MNKKYAVLPAGYDNQNNGYAVSATLWETQAQAETFAKQQVARSAQSGIQEWAIYEVCTLVAPSSAPVIVTNVRPAQEEAK